MFRIVSVLACPGLLAALLAIGGCGGGTVIGGGGGGGSDEGGRDGWGGWGDCGSRTVASVPDPGFVETEFSFELDAVPADSALVKVLLAGTTCQPALDTQEGKMLYEVGQQGVVLSLTTLSEIMGQKSYIRIPLSFDQRFVVEDGCLSFDIEMPEEDELPEFDPTELPKGPCGLGQLAIGHEGMVISEPEGEYVCVQVSITSVCRDCWAEDGVWYGESVMSGSYVALGSIDNVSVSTWALLCGEDDQPVSIRTGDRVDYTQTIRTEYRMSPSPEELGYEEFVLP